MNHTPGPWKAYESKGREYKIHAAVGTLEEFDIATVRFGLDAKTMKQQDQSAQANADLIAAAPELLDALEEMRIFAEGVRDEWQNDNPGKEYNPFRLKLIAQAKQAILKAKGA